MKREEKLKQGFTLIELMVVIAIIGILGTVLMPKVMMALRKAKVSKVQGYRYESQSLITISLELPDLLSQPINKNILEKYEIKETPAFIYNGIHHDKSNHIVDIRSNDGGWIYDNVNGKIYVNLPNGAYTGDEEYEIWDGQGPKSSNKALATNPQTSAQSQGTSSTTTPAPKIVTTTKGTTATTSGTAIPSTGIATTTKGTGSGQGGGVPVKPQTPIEQKFVSGDTRVNSDSNLAKSIVGGTHGDIQSGGRLEINPQSSLGFPGGKNLALEDYHVYLDNQDVTAKLNGHTLIIEKIDGHYPTTVSVVGKLSDGTYTKGTLTLSYQNSGISRN